MQNWRNRLLWELVSLHNRFIGLSRPDCRPVVCERLAWLFAATIFLLFFVKVWCKCNSSVCRDVRCCPHCTVVLVSENRLSATKWYWLWLPNQEGNTAGLLLTYHHYWRVVSAIWSRWYVERAIVLKWWLDLINFRWLLSARDMWPKNWWSERNGLLRHKYLWIMKSTVWPDFVGSAICTFPIQPKTQRQIIFEWFTQRLTASPTRTSRRRQCVPLKMNGNNPLCVPCDCVRRVGDMHT